MSFGLESFDFMGLLPSSKEIPDRRKNKYLMNARREKEKKIYKQKEREREWGPTLGAEEQELKGGREEREGGRRKSSTKLRAFLHNGSITHAEENQIAYDE